MDQNVKKNIYIYIYIYILEENVRENHHDLKLCKEFLEITQKG